MTELLVVYTMGKVASTTISRAINSRIACHDVHFLRKEAIINRMRISAENGEIPHNHYGRSINIFRQFHGTGRVKIITCVRDSFSRNISATFQNLPEKDYTLNDIQNEIEKRDPDVPGKWFKQEFESTTGIDILMKPFDLETKYSLFSEGRFDVLLMRIDLENEVKQRLISEFLGEEVELRNQNLAAKKMVQPSL